MERRRKYSRHLFHTLHTLLPPVLRVTQISLLVFCSLYLLVDYAEGIMTFPDERGVYSLFPDEDLKTGRKRFRFDEETTRSYRDREGREYSHVVRSYPMLPHDRLHRPVDFSGGGSSRQVYDSYRDRDRVRDRSRERDRDRSRERDRDRSRERQGRVYFDDRFRTSRFEFHRLTPRPRPIDRPVSPIIFETSRRPPPNHHNRFFHEGFPPPPAVGQSKLPPGASTRASSEDPVPPTRIHVFNPDSVSFGNPRHAGGGESSREESSAERVKNPPSNFVETGPPGPESFLNHDEFLEYQKKIAFARFHEQDANSGPPGESRGNNGKKVLFESKEPFEIDGLEPPERSRESPGKLPTTIGSPIEGNQGQSSSSSQRFNHQIYDQRQHQRHGEGQQGRGNGPPSHHQNHHHHHHSKPPNVDDNGGAGEEGDTEGGGGGEVESDIVNGKGEEVESENGKSEVRLPPHTPKSGRALSSSDDVGEGINSKKITPSVSYNENVGGRTGFKLPLPTSAVLSYSGGGDRDHDEPPNLNGFVPVVPFHLIGPEQPRAISLERQRQQQQHHIVPHHHHEPHEYSTTARSTTTPSTTVRSIPVPTTIASMTTTHRVKVAKSGFTGFIPTPEVTKFSSSSSSSSATSSFSNKFSVENAGNGNNGGGGDIGIVVSAGIGGSPASPILHATAGERSNSETHSKVAITKQQELKRLQKQRQQLTTHSEQHQLTNSNPPNAEPPPSHSSSDGLFPQISGLGETSSSADSADNSGHTPGTLTNMPNSYILDVDDDDDDTSSHTEDRTPSSTPSTLPTASPTTSSASSEHDFNMNSHHHTNILEQSPFQLHTISSKNIKHNRTLLHVKDDETELNKLSSTSSGGEKISTLLDSENNEIFDTQPIKTANGIRQGEFHLEGYMISGDGGDGRSLSSRSNSVSSSGSSSADYSNNNEENIVENQPNYPHRSYDYPEEHEERLPIVGVGVNNDVSFGTDSPIIPEVNQNDISHDNNALSHNNHRGADDDGIVISQFPGTTVTPDLGDLTPPQKNTTPYHDIQPTSSTFQEGASRNDNDDETHVTGNDYFSKNTQQRPEPNSRSDGASGYDGSLVVDDLALESEPAPPPELRRTRFSENDDDNSYAGLGPIISPYHNENSIEQDEPVGVYPYYGQFGNKINVTESKSSGISSSIPSSGFNSDDEDHDVGGDEFHEDGNDSFEVLDLHGKSFDLDGSNPDKRIGSSASINSGELSRLKSSNGISDIIPFDDSDNPSFISIPVEATLNTGLAPPAPYFSSNSVENSHSKKDLEESFVAGANGEDSREQSSSFDNSPLYLESSETLINKTYYLDGNSLSSKSYKHYNGSMKDAIINSLKSSNFIKVTRIKGGLTPSSKETIEKTSATILASSKRPAKPAVIVSATGAGLRPRVVGSVVEAGPAWPGLVSNFIRTNNPGPPPGYNRTFTATATVRPRGNSGTNPTHPTTVISGQVQKVTLTPVPTAAQQRQLLRQQKEQAEQTQFQLQQIRHPTLTTNIGNTNRPSNVRSSASPPPTQSQSRSTKASASNKSHQHNYITNSSVISSVINNGGGPSLVKQVSSKLISNDNKNNINIPPPPPPPPTNATDGGQAHVVTRRLYSSEEDSSSAQIKNNSSSGVVSLVHAHISHCPKLHSPTEVICDVHIREGHGVPNPQLTVGWRRKYYNATTPDVLLTLNKAPASGEGGHFDPHHSVMEVEPGKEGERLEEFHDKFNVTLAPGISPMLRSVLLIRSVAPPDCGTYQCEVSDGVNVLTSETLLFLCH